jgi:hypothetical protein
MDNIKNIIIIIIIILLINELFFSECKSNQTNKLILSHRIPSNFDPAKINPTSL